MPTKAKVAAKTKIVRAAVSNDVIVAEYAELVAKAEKLEARMEEIRLFVRASITRGETFETEQGKFNLIPTKSMRWLVQDVKDVLGKDWLQYIAADNKLLKLRVEAGIKEGTPDAVAAQLQKRANITESEQLRFLRK